jgi:hypothetical protein
VVLRIDDRALVAEQQDRVGHLQLAEAQHVRPDPPVDGKHPVRCGGFGEIAVGRSWPVRSFRGRPGPAARHEPLPGVASSRSAVLLTTKSGWRTYSRRSTCGPAVPVAPAAPGTGSPSGR